MIVKNIIINNFRGAVTAACLLAATSGIAIGWSSPVIPKLQSIQDDNPFDQPITTTQASWMTSLVTLGACTGCCFFGFLANLLGRRFATCALGIPMTLSYAMMALFPRLEVFYVARFLAGLGLGGGNITSMAFNSEITSKFNRGVVMTLTSMMVSGGALFSYCIGPWLSVTTFNSIMMIIPLATTALALIFCKETPYFYLIKNKEKLAEESLRAYRGRSIKIEKEMMEIKENIKQQQMGNLLEVIKTKAFLKSFIIATMLLIFQQFTGVNGILMYSQTIFDITGSNLSAAVCSIILAAIQLVSGGIAPLVAEKFNRKTLLIVSSTGMILSEIVLGIYCILREANMNVNAFKFIPVTTLCLFIFSYNFGVGPLCWIVGSEVYATRVKTLAMSFSIFMYYIIGFFIAQYFNSVVNTIGIGAVFLGFAGCCVLCILFVQFYVIETKGKSLEEIQRILKK